MIRIKYFQFAIWLFFLSVGCTDKDDKLVIFENYFTALNKKSGDRWKYTADTVQLWFDNKNGKPTLQIKGEEATSEWKEWDNEMHSNSHYDTIWVDDKENAVKGFFYENNDFYDLIGKSPTKTLRTYWFDEDAKICEILIYWIPGENTETSQHLKPVVEWALKYDPLEIATLYPNNRILPSRESARRWKKLLQKYRESKKKENQ